MDKQTRYYYEERAEELCRQYQSASPPHQDLFRHFFSPGERVLDVGCGSGRDLSALQDAGYEAYGVDPSQPLLDQAAAANHRLAGRLVKGSLPREMGSLFGDQLFDGILLSAVLMHIPDEDLFETAFALKRLLRSGGRVLLSHCTRRPGLVDGRAPDGRLFVLRSAEQVKLLFERLGFRAICETANQDTLGREGLEWVTQLFQLSGEGACQSIDRIESIINNDKKTATYKLALLRALCDVAQRAPHLARWREGGQVAVPMDALVDKWMEYYLPLVTNPDFVPQIQGEHAGAVKPIAFRGILTDLGRHYGQGPMALGQLLDDRDRARLPAGVEPLLRKAQRKIANTIRVNPVQYTSGDTFAYDARTRSVLLEGAIWRELILLGHWIEDSLLLRWAELIHQFSGRRFPLIKALGLLLQKPEANRRVDAARSVYQEIPDLRCVWSERALAPGAMHVDHAIPFSLRHDNSLWNLLPSHAKVNQNKSDLLPGTALLSRRRDLIIHYWQQLHRREENLFEHEAGRFMGRSQWVAHHWELDLYRVFSETVESTAVLRGTERWSGGLVE